RSPRRRSASRDARTRIHAGSDRRRRGECAPRPRAHMTRKWNESACPTWSPARAPTVTVSVQSIAWIHPYLSDQGLNLPSRKGNGKVWMERRASLQRKLVMLVAVSIVIATAFSTGIALWQQTTSYLGLRRQALLATAEVFAAAAAQATAAHDAHT